MKVVSSVPFGARGCAVTGRSADPEGFIAANSPLDGQALYICAASVKVMAHEFGMLPKQEAIDMRFRLHTAEKQLAEAERTIRDQELLEQELAAARDTIREAEDVVSTFVGLAEDGYTGPKAKALLGQIETFENQLGEAKHTLAELFDALNRGEALARNGTREKVTA